jgi:hypothetical protein
MVPFMSTNWFPASLDSRGSLNLPAGIKHAAGLGVGSPLLIREVEGILVVVSLTGEAAQAHQGNSLEAWVDQRLRSTLPPAPVTLGTTALAEAARTQRAREKHQMKMQEMQMEHALILARRGVVPQPAAEAPAALPQAAPE